MVSSLSEISVAAQTALDSRARQLRGAAPLNIELKLIKRVRAFADSYNKPFQLGPPQQTRSLTSPHKHFGTHVRQNDTDMSR